MLDSNSVIDAVRLVAKATKDDPDKLPDIVKGALRPDQIDDMRLMLSRAREGSVLHRTATASAAASAPAASASEFPPLGRRRLIRRYSSLMLRWPLWPEERALYTRRRSR